MVWIGCKSVVSSRNRLSFATLIQTDEFYRKIGKGMRQILFEQLLFGVGFIVLMSCNSDQECPPTIFERGIVDDNLFYGTWRWVDTKVWEEDGQGNYYLAGIISPTQQPFSGLPTLGSASLKVSDNLCLIKDNVEDHCIDKWRTSLSSAPSDPIPNRVLSIYYNNTSFIRLVFENTNSDTVICPDFPFRVINAASTDNYFVRQN